MGDVAIRVDSIGKAYRIGVNEQRHETMFGAVAAFVKSPFANFRNLRSLSRFDSFDSEDVVWALKDVSFEVREGDVVGIIGHNGAGKSTLLKILSRITEPTTGAAYVHGRVGSLLEVGTGFHPDLTGRENVYLNGTILGMRKREIDSKFDQIVEFSGVEKFIDTPVKRYSSGMRVRLAFSVAAHLEPEILIVDEVLAVGDAEFQKRCMGKMGDVAKEGRTVLFVSHSMAAVENLCEHGVVLASGKVVFKGRSKDAIQHYFKSFSEGRSPALVHSDRRAGKGRVRMTRVWLCCQGQESTVVPAGSRIQLMIEYETQSEPVTFITMRVGWTNVLGEPMFGCANHYSGDPIDVLPGPRGTIVLDIPELPLAEGVYRANIWIKSQNELEDKASDVIELTVNGGDFFGTGRLLPADCGEFYVKHRFRVETRSGGASLAIAEEASKSRGE